MTPKYTQSHDRLTLALNDLHKVRLTLSRYRQTMSAKPSVDPELFKKASAKFVEFMAKKEAGSNGEKMDRLQKIAAASDTFKDFVEAEWV
jgi:hypothetical protein